MNAQLMMNRPANLGNVWMMAATMAHGIVAAGGGGVHVVTVATDGSLEAVTADHPDFEERLLAPGYVGTVSGTTDVTRLAVRIREAVMALRE